MLMGWDKDPSLSDAIHVPTASNWNNGTVGPGVEKLTLTFSWGHTAGYRQRGIKQL